jgi:hypothetical protein
MRRALGLAVLAGGHVLWRRRAGRRERVELAFDDGAAVVLDRGRDADALLALARRAL